MVKVLFGDVLGLPPRDFSDDGFRPSLFGSKKRVRQTADGLARPPIREWRFLSDDNDDVTTHGTSSYVPLGRDVPGQRRYDDTKRADPEDWQRARAMHSGDVRVITADPGPVSLSDDVTTGEGDESVWIPQLHLTIRDRVELLSGEMLTDKHIYAAQKLLSKQMPQIHGLQDPVLSQVGFCPVHKESLQIHHTQGDHWVLSAWTPGDIVHVYDTLYDFVSPDLLRQLEEIYVDAPHTETGRLIYDMPSIQKQCGSRDCGLFAIALATELCFGSDLTQVQFDQSRMREHFYRCLRKRHMEPFPTEYIVL